MDVFSILRRRPKLERKESAVGRLISLSLLGRPRWTPRNYAQLADEGFQKNLVPYRCPSASAMQSFLLLLRKAGVNAHLRRSRGLDIDSACGQLRRRESLKR